MDWFTGIVIYILLWWFAFFMVLPVGVRREEEVQVGNDTGAPSNPMLGRKILAAFVIAAVFWGGLQALVLSDLISFREMIRDW
jgi:predicted secreted protein